MSTFTTRDGVSIHCKDWGAGRPDALNLTHAQRLNDELLAFARA
ncbi:hypothetical protein [Burkholderia sp. Bp8992]|nr:hypothetical protein [Burkholderia sp. Bp8992]